MGTQLAPSEMELYRRVDEVLFYKWDPIGVSDAPETRDEYLSYLPTVFSLVKRDASAPEIAKFLREVADRMGLPETPATRDRDLKVAGLLRAHAKVIAGRSG